MKTISYVGLKSIIGNGNYQIIDLRSVDKYREWHIEGAMNIPYSVLKNSMSYINRKKTIVFYCEKGNSSIMAGRFLERMEYNVIAVVSKDSDLRQYCRFK